MPHDVFRISRSLTKVKTHLLSVHHRNVKHRRWLVFPQTLWKLLQNSTLQQVPQLEIFVVVEMMTD